MVTRFLVAPVGSSGDVMPLVEVASALKARGHDVHACATRDFAGVFEQRGVTFQAIDVDASALTGSLDGGVVDLLRAGKKIRSAAGAATAALDAACADVDVVVGAGLQVIAPVFCEARGIEYVYASTGPTNERSAGLPPHFVPMYRTGRRARAALWRAQDAACHLLFGAAVDGLRRELGLPRRTRPLWDTASAPGVTVGLYDRVLVGPSHRAAEPLGAALPMSPPAPLAPDIERFLAAGAPPVFVGFGSMRARDVRSRTAAVVAALRACGRRGVLDAGWGGLDPEAQPEADDLCWVSSDSFRALIPRVAAIVHHGGAGTTALAARAGVPQVTVPHITDNFYWSRSVASLGLGSAPLAVKRLSADRLAARLHAALGSDEMSERAQDVARTLASADGAAAAASALAPATT